MFLNFRRSDDWMVRVLKSVASEGEGIGGIGEEIAAHRAHLESSGQLVHRRGMRMNRRIRELITDRLHVDLWTAEREALLRAKVDDVLAFRCTPYDAADVIVDDFRGRVLGVR
jgi:putative protein kinase ArgK-like GTPase of G3E family